MDIRIAAVACIAYLSYGQAWPVQLGKSRQTFELSEVARLTGTAGRGDPLEGLAMLFLTEDPKVAFHPPGPRPSSQVQHTKHAVEGATAKRVTNPPQAFFDFFWRDAATKFGLPLADQQLHAYEWTSTLAQPAALVAGAALASMYELSKELEPAAGDGRRMSIAKKLAKLLFVSAFAFEIACVFATTVTGTMLLGKGVSNPLAYHPMEMLHRELEFEYIFCRASFFQGLLNWLVAVAVHQSLPRKNVSMAATHIKRSTSCFIVTMVMYMLAFYNKHMSYYQNYAAMLGRFLQLVFKRYYRDGFRVLPLIALLPLGLGLKYAWSSIGDFHNKH